MRSFLIFLILLFFISANAQVVPLNDGSNENNIKSNDQSVCDTILPAGRNELVLNVAPVFTAMFGSYSTTESKFSIYYKRTLKNPRVALRIGATYKREMRNFPSNYKSEWYFDITDTSRTANVFYRSPQNKWQLNVGVEWRSKNASRWSTYWGLDLMGGFYSNYFSLYDLHETKAANGYWTSTVSDYGNVTSGNFIQLDHQNSFNWYVGISPFYGVRYAFNPRWMLSIQTGFDSYFLNGESFRRDSFGTTLIHENYNSFNFNIPSPLNQFDLVYRFGSCKKKSEK